MSGLFFPATFPLTRRSVAKYKAKDVLSYCVLDHPIRPEENLDKAGMRVFSEEEFNRYKNMKTWWIVTSPNFLAIYKPPIGNREVCVRSNGLYGEDDRMLHPQLVSKGFEWATCVPRKNEKWKGLWWRPTPEDSVVLQSSIIVTTTRYLKKEAYRILEEELVKATDRAFSTLAANPKATLLGSLVTHAKQCLERLESFGLTYADMIVCVGDFQRSCLDIHALVDFITIFYPRSHPTSREQDIFWPCD